MSRDIFIGYREVPDGPEKPIELRPPYFLFGTQQTSKRFWSLPVLAEIGLRRLTDLGTIDPIYFIGWEAIAELDRELSIVRSNLPSIQFDPKEPVASWLSHLVYCHALLVLEAPKNSIPELTIG